jgi:hypothetical protein
MAAAPPVAAIALFCRVIALSSPSWQRRRRPGWSGAGALVAAMTGGLAFNRYWLRASTK